MDGKKYFELKASAPVGADAIYNGGGSFGNALAEANNDFLFEQLDTLYRGQEVHFLTDDTPTESLALAEENITIQRIGEFGVVNFSNSRGIEKYALSSRTAAGRTEDHSDELEQSELMQDLRVGFTTERSLLADISSIVLAHAVRGIFRQRDRIKSGKTDVPTIVNAAVSSNKKLLLEGLDSVMRIDVTKAGGSDDAEVDAKGISPHHSAPKWLKNTAEWNGLLQFRASQGLLEIDTFAALTQWCFERKLGALVIPSPRQIENGLPLPNGKNANADLLVVSLVDNKVVPVQVKNRNNHHDDDEYIDEMVKVTPSRIGLVDPTTRIQRVNGHVKTVSAHTTHYGSHASLLHADYSGKIRKGSHDAEQERRAKAFAFFDYKVLPQLAA